jgi:hypothetical protein
MKPPEAQTASVTGARTSTGRATGALTPGDTPAPPNTLKGNKR